MSKRTRRSLNRELIPRKRREGLRNIPLSDDIGDDSNKAGLPKKLSILTLTKEFIEEENQDGKKGFEELTRPNAKWRQLGIHINFTPSLNEVTVDLVRRIANTEFYVCLEDAKQTESVRVAQRRQQIEKTGKGKNPTSRPTDLALRLLVGKGLTCNQERLFGHVPGVKIGDKFQYKAQIKAVGLHRQTMAGIDYMASREMPEKEFPALATSICVAGCYEDDDDNGTEMMYTGQGGNDLRGRQVQIADQKLARGNLALLHNAEYGVPVRVIKKNADQYIYDGLWDVLRMIKTRGIEQKIVYQYKMRRCPGQEPSSARQVSFREGVIPKQVSYLLKLERNEVCPDFSKGMSRTPIPVVNNIDNELPSGLLLTDLTSEVQQVKHWQESTAQFEYGHEMRIDVDCSPISPIPEIPENYKSNPHGYLKELNSGLDPYKADGRIKHAMCILYECGPWLQCPKKEDCEHSVTTTQPRWKFQLFRTKTKGWGVRTLDVIPVGCFVIKYVGEVFPVEKASADDVYSFNLTKRPDYTDENEYTEQLIDVAPKFVVTGKQYGNLFRFINHSCDPNCFTQPVLSEHLDKWRPDICLYAMRRIYPGEELCYDYGREYVDKLLDTKCMCDSACCVKRIINV